LYLREFAHAADYKYNYISLCYFGLTVLFFFLWILQIFCVVFFELAKIVEWLILLTALVLQCYAEYSLYEHTPKFVNTGRILCNKIHMDASLVIKSISCTFIFTLVLMIFSAPPWFMHFLQSRPLVMCDKMGLPVEDAFGLIPSDQTFRPLVLVVYEAANGAGDAQGLWHPSSCRGGR
jgi:hypothetical protein